MPKTPDVRWRQRFQSFGKAFTQLAAAADLARQKKADDSNSRGSIRAFEFTHELAWNCPEGFPGSRVLTNLYGSKDATREAFDKGLIAKRGGIDGDDPGPQSQQPHLQ